MKFIIDFLRTVVEEEQHNKMTHYNIAVTVGPNIFRPKDLKPSDLINAGTFYDIMIRMMTNFDEIFDNEAVTAGQIAEIRMKISEEEQKNSVPLTQS